jgi:phenylacetate-coenzyme A ligase PaaK-like adenylate-forming protein
MQFIQEFKNNLFTTNTENFAEKTLQLFRFQAENNKVYSSYLKHLNVNPAQVDTIPKIPFLPIDFFKHHQVISTTQPHQKIFESSGTTQALTSKHFVTDVPFYLNNCEEIFKLRYGPLEDYIFFALLPSYLERDTSSLVYMVKHFIERSKSLFSGFYLHNTSEMLGNIRQARAAGKKIMLIGVTFALLDLAEEFAEDLSDIILMETGGMKGRRKELLREEVHAILAERLNCRKIHSEYGMTELLSQAYAPEGGIFFTPPWMKLILRDPNDPFDFSVSRTSGGVNIIDLANVDSCAFIETSDLGSYQSGGGIKILGRMDNSDIRGCNLLIA